jgi:hypothetical protein
MTDSERFVAEPLPAFQLDIFVCERSGGVCVQHEQYNRTFILNSDVTHWLSPGNCDGG